MVNGLLRRFSQIHISIYGISEEECKAITRKNHFGRLLPNLTRLARLWNNSPQTCDIKIAFRLLQDHPREKLEEFLADNCGRVFPFSSSFHYANWGNSMSGRLPGEAQFVAVQENCNPCAFLLLALQVYWDGRVSACACCDYDGSDELYLGDVKKQTLLSIFDGPESREVWRQHETGKLPEICQRCTFFSPLSSLHKVHPIAVRPFDFIGG